MNKVEFWIAIAIVIALQLFLIQEVATIKTSLETGSHLNGVKVIASISADTPWAQLPPFIRDDMGKGWSGNKLDKQDLIDIRDYYNQKIATIKDGAIAIADDFKEGKLK